MPQKGMIEILDKDTNSAVEDVDFLDDFEDQSETEPAGLNMLLNKLMTDQEEEDDGLSEDDILEDIDDLLDEEDDSEDESVDESEEEVNLLGEEEETYLGDEDLDDFESLDELEEEKVERDAKKDTTMLFIPADKIHPNKMNDFSVEDDLTPLKTSIEYFGLRQPLDVLPEEDGSYRLVGGERRYRAICQSIEEGSRQFVDGIPCVVNTKAINSDLDEQILIYEENIHNRDMHVGYLEKIKTLYYLYQEKKARDGGAFAGSVMRRLANQLGLTMRQTRKIVRVATTPDTWISEAFSKGKLTLETCSVINGLDDSSKEELREYYDEHGDIPSELLDRFRKVKGPLIAQMEAEAKQNEEMPKGGSETGGTAFGNFMNTPEESEGKVEQPSFAPKFPEPPVTSGRFTTSPAAYTGPSTSAVTPPITPPAASSPAHQEQNDSSVPNAADILDSRPVPEKKPRPVIKNSEGKTISPEEIRLDYYSDGPYGDSSYEEDYDEMDSRKWEEEKEAKKIRDKDLQMSSDSYATASQGDDNSAMTAFIWFDEMSKRGCTETELSFIIPMLGMMEKFLIDHYVENGYIDEKAYPVLSSIVQKLTPLLS